MNDSRSMIDDSPGWQVTSQKRPLRFRDTVDTGGVARLAEGHANQEKINAVKCNHYSATDGQA
jgi:hypothetical protein